MSIKIVIDKTGTLYDLINTGNGKVKLSSQKFPKISHVYKKQFINCAIKGGILTEIPMQASFIPEKQVAHR